MILMEHSFYEATIGEKWNVCGMIINKLSFLQLRFSYKYIPTKLLYLNSPYLINYISKIVLWIYI